MILIPLAITAAVIAGLAYTRVRDGLKYGDLILVAPMASPELDALSTQMRLTNGVNAPSFIVQYTNQNEGSPTFQGLARGYILSSPLDYTSTPFPLAASPSATVDESRIIAVYRDGKLLRTPGGFAKYPETLEI